MDTSSTPPVTSENLNSISRVKQYINDTYFEALFEEFGESFFEYRKRWNSSLQGDLASINQGPIHIDLELSNSCNYRCTFCPYSVPEESWPDGFGSDKEMVKMPFQLAKRVLEEARDCGAVALELGYNTEPLMYPDLIPLIKYARELGFIDIRMGTNGSLLKPSTSDQLVASGLTQLQVSLDAIDSRTYKLSRNSNLYDKVVSNIDYFLHLRKKLDQRLPVLRVTYVLTPENQKYKQQFLDSWANKADIVALQDLFIYENVNENMNDDKEVSSAHNNPTTINENCYMPKVRLSIKSDGVVHPCCTVPGMALSVGNLHESSIMDIWHSSPMTKIRNLHIDSSWKSHSICNDCMNNK